MSKRRRSTTLAATLLSASVALLIPSPLLGQESSPKRQGQGEGPRLLEKQSRDLAEPPRNLQSVNELTKEVTVLSRQFAASMERVTSLEQKLGYVDGTLKDLRAQLSAVAGKDELTNIRKQFRELDQIQTRLSAQLAMIDEQVRALRQQLIDSDVNVRQVREDLYMAADLAQENAQTKELLLLGAPVVLGAVGVGFGFVVIRLRTSQMRTRALIRQAQAASDFIRLFPRTNPYVVGSPILEEEMFFGRADILATIMRGIYNNSYYLRGERRSGKTSVLRRLEKDIGEIRHADTVFQTATLDLQSLTEETLYEGIGDALADSLRRSEHRHGVDLSAALSEPRAENVDDLRELVEGIVAAVGAALAKNVIVVLLIDEFDKMNGFDLRYKEALRYVFMHSPDLRLVGAGGPLVVWDQSSPFNFMIEIELGALAEDAARRLITEPAKGIVAWDDDVVDEILSVNQGKPYLIQDTCFKIVDRALATSVFRIDRAMWKSWVEQQGGVGQMPIEAV